MGIPLNTMDAVRASARTGELLKEAGFFDAVHGAGQAARSWFAGLPRATRLQAKNLIRLNRGEPVAEGGFQEAFKRFIHPIEGVRKGWTQMSPRAKSTASALQQGKTLEQLTPQVTGDLTKAMTNLQKLKAGGGSPEQLAAAQDAVAAAKETFAKTFGGSGAHLAAPSQTLGQAWRTGGARGVASELSRGGWTGSGDITKYLPNVGGKPLMVGLPVGFGAYEIAKARDPSRTGQGAAAEVGLRQLLGGAGMIAGMGTGFLPGMALWYGADEVGLRAGRIIDRLRAGATIPEAVMAPSPEQARSQLQNIAKYYG